MSSSVASSSRRRSVTSGSPSVSSNGSAYAASSTSSSRLVTRLALEGKVKHNSREAEMKMYLKISVPWDYANPGTTHQLFPEENLKIISTIVHPLDSSSAPFKYSSEEFPLLHSATKMLNLPPMLDESFTSLFPILYDRQPSYLSSSSRSSSSNGITHAVDAKYTGHMTVSGYNVSYVMPREFPPLDERSSHSISSNPKHRRRSSVGERGAFQYLIAITMLVPFLTVPPRAPFMLSIPVPRCLSNNVKLRIFTPKARTSSSYASISSAEEDNTTWELMSEPPVTLSTSHSRHKSYPSKDADDESSETSTAGLSEGCSLKGTFPSTEKLQIRWANPPRGVGAASNHSRRLVGVEMVQGETTCTIIGKGKMRDEDGDAVLMKIEHKSTCKNIWYAGVAIHLGMDLSLDTNSCQFEWPDNAEPGWTVTGGIGFTGWDTGDNPEPFSRPQTPYSPFEPEQSGYASNVRQRISSRSSSNSLLRTPLTPPEVPEYSFESSPSTPTGSMMSSMGSLVRPDSAPSFDRSPMPDGQTPIPNPASPVIIHLNMDDLMGASTKEGFLFHITGVVLVRPRYPSTKVNLHDSTTVTPVIGLPRFRVHAADAESVSVTVKNETLNDAMEVFHPTGDIRDAQTRRTVLQRGAVARCGVEGARVALRSTAPLLHSRSILNSEDSMSETTMPTRSITSPERRLVQPAVPATEVAQTLHPSTAPSYALISHIRADVIMIPSSEPKSNVYVVSVSFVAPGTMGDDFEWGIACPEATTSIPVIQDLVVTANGLVVRLSASDSQASTGLGIQGVFKQFNAREKTDWLQWIKTDSKISPGSTVMLQYTVKLTQASDARRSSRKASYAVPVVLPSFSMAFARLDVDVKASQDMLITSGGNHNFAVHYTTPDGPRWSCFSTDELFRPNLTVVIGSIDLAAPNPNAALIKRILLLLPTLLSLLVLFKALQVEQRLPIPSREIFQDTMHATTDMPTTTWSDVIPPPTVSTDHLDSIHTSESTDWRRPTFEPVSHEASANIPTSPATSDSPPPPSPDAVVKEAPPIHQPITTTSLPEWTPIPDDIVVRLSQPDLLHFVRSKLPQSEDVTHVISKGLKKAWRWWQIVVNFPLPPPDD